MSSVLLCVLLSRGVASASQPDGLEYDYAVSPKLVCTPIPPEADPSCYSPPSAPRGAGGHGGGGHNGSSRRAVLSEEAKATILHLRESLVRQKEVILDQRETIREITAKLTLCEGFGGHHNTVTMAPGPTMGPTMAMTTTTPTGGLSHSEPSSFSADQTAKTLQTLKERLENLQARNSSSSYSSSLRDLLKRKITALEEQLHNHYRPYHNDHHGSGHHVTHSKTPLKNPDTFQISFPMRTNYMHARMRTPVLKEIFALTICLWLRGGPGVQGGQGLGTPFSYAVPGQANELVLIEWGSNPMELLVDDKAYLDGRREGSGENLSAWRPVRAGGTFLLGQEQDSVGGGFDASQSLVGDVSDLQFWSRVLSPGEVSGQASCEAHLTGDILSWSQATLELYGGVAHQPFQACH
ncbi:hypothetical protein CRUP_009540 [Coryphaenoides rupestris]|nr:hypothetical protein CRUP_009540 [Coryphaenoides rupestris]